MWYPGGSEMEEIQVIPKYKTFEELKQELGDKFEEFMYKANIELLTIRDEVIKIISNDTDLNSSRQRKRLIEILKGVK